ncbi:VOC family protein [Shinella sp.]|uniref:VOC family protein n=1 Tax=Shinella sp. TaxID=1870904 RepID=UPI003F7266F1
MPKMIFVNLPVKDLAAATHFYEAIGCQKNAQFSDEQASSVVWSDDITFQLLSRDYFSTFTPKPVADAHASCQVLIALSHDSREHVDAIADAGAAAGGKADIREPLDMGFLYNRAVEDPDGHVLELTWMDMSQAGEMVGA